MSLALDAAPPLPHPFWADLTGQHQQQAEPRRRPQTAISLSRNASLRSSGGRPISAGSGGWGADAWQQQQQPVSTAQRAPLGSSGAAGMGPAEREQV